jgi:hypothetical protein
LLRVRVRVRVRVRIRVVWMRVSLGVFMVKIGGIFSSESSYNDPWT